MEDLDKDWVLSLLEYQKSGKVLHKKYATMIIQKARDLFEDESSLQHIRVPDD
jgi:hypothetical protein